MKLTPSVKSCIYKYHSGSTACNYIHFFFCQGMVGYIIYKCQFIMKALYSPLVSFLLLLTMCEIMLF